MFCLSCNKTILGDRTDLAQHIMSAKRGHDRSKRFAARILTDVRRLDRKVTFLARNKGRTKLTEEQKQIKKDLVRQVSGAVQSVLTVCPKCCKGHEEKLEVEYINSPSAPRSHSGKLLRLCEGCR